MIRSLGEASPSATCSPTIARSVWQRHHYAHRVTSSSVPHRVMAAQKQEHLPRPCKSALECRMGQASFFQHTVVLITYTSFFKDCSHISTGFQVRKVMALHQYSQFWYNGSSFAVCVPRLYKPLKGRNLRYGQVPLLWCGNAARR